MIPRRATAVVPVKARTSSSSPAPRIDVMVSSNRLEFLFLIVLRDSRTMPMTMCSKRAVLWSCLQSLFVKFHDFALHSDDSVKRIRCHADETEIGRDF